MAYAFNTHEPARGDLWAVSVSSFIAPRRFVACPPAPPGPPGRARAVTSGWDSPSLTDRTIRAAGASLNSRQEPLPAQGWLRGRLASPGLEVPRPAPQKKRARAASSAARAVCQSCSREKALSEFKKKRDGAPGTRCIACAAYGSKVRTHTQNQAKRSFSLGGAGACFIAALAQPPFAARDQARETRTPAVFHLLGRAASRSVQKRRPDADHLLLMPRYQQGHPRGLSHLLLDEFEDERKAERHCGHRLARVPAAAV